MLYDNDCGFCRHWIEKWRRKTGDHVRYEPYQKRLAAYPQVTEAQCREAVQLLLPQGTVYSGAHAVLKALSLAGQHRCCLAAYEKFPWLRWLMETAYRWTARHRSSLFRFYKVSRGSQ
ncbi:MAG: thiol-disulfide oxidoreductase DCC family protein [Candidatus Omnitrophota bacterium]